MKNVRIFSPESRVTRSGWMLLFFISACTGIFGQSGFFQGQIHYIIRVSGKGADAFLLDEPPTQMDLNMGAEDFRVASLTTSGNILEVIESAGNYWKVKALNFSGVLPSYAEALTRPGVIHWATEVRGNVVSNFPDLEAALGKPFGVPVPNPSLAGYQYIAKELVTEVPNGKTWEIYT